MSTPRYKIRYLFPAEDDLLSIIDYIAEDNPTAADKMVDRFEKAIGRLALSPFAGKVPDDDELRKRNYRMLIVGKYFVFYKVKEKAVEIHRIIHGARDYKHLLLSLS
jgi:plasmid stabilization system protein ParE